MTNSWVNDAVSAFGRQMGLMHFALNERGTAAVRFENGIGLKFENAGDSLMVCATTAMPAEELAMKKLFVAVHPDARVPMPARALYFAKTGEGAYVVRLSDREVNVSSIEAAFRTVWTLTDTLRRAVA